MRFRLGPEWSPLELRFAHAEPPYRQAYERFFRCPLRFGARAHGVVFDAAVLALPNPVDTAIAELIERRAESALARLDGEPNCAERVREVLASGLPSGAIGADAVTHALHMSRATLTRKLALEGTSLSAVLDALRRELALEYVRDPRLSIEELARRLAFSDARALRRAFVRWTGTTPSALREQIESSR
jgi:AraC-like DNA-binding protein